MVGHSQSLKTVLERLRAEAHHLPRALALVWRASRWMVIVWVALLILQGIVPVAVVYLTRALVNRLAEAVRAGVAWDNAGPTLFMVGILAGILLAAEILRGVSNWVRSAQAELVQDSIAGLIHEKSVAADLAFYETPEFYDHLHRARAEAGYRPVALVENLGSLFQNSVTFLGMAAVLIPFGIWLPAALLVSTLPGLLTVVRHAIREHDWQLRITADERRTWYYDWLLTSGEPAAEVRLLGIGHHFRTAYQALRQCLREQRLRMKKTQAAAELAAAAFGLLVTGGVMVWVVWRMMGGFATLGDLALFYQAFNQGQALLRTVLGNAGQIYANVLFLGNLFAFLDLQPRVTDPARPVPAVPRIETSICFRGVTFRYPGSSRNSLQDLDLTIPAGQMAAIVGPNGAGKSTLIKLACRFYDPAAGSITIDHQALGSMRLEDLRSRISVLFQTPVHYNTSARENIALGDSARRPAAAEIEAAAQAAGAAECIAALPRGFDNLLGRWFENGAELSVGEWQKIALARAFLRRAPLLLLDEPTSAMDSFAETVWLERLRQLAEGQTAIIITHRLTTAMRADIIHVMVDGRIVESGTHRALIAGHGWYARSWARQMEVQACAS
jgi:ATP-binding cassette, subfamily B, bacterial